MPKLLRLKQKTRQYYFFTGVTIATSAANFLFSVFARSLIDPLEYGIYSTCLLAQTYLAFLQLGTLNAFNRDYPQLIGSEDYEEANKYSGVVLSFILVAYTSVVALVQIGVIVFSACNHSSDIPYAYGIGICALTAAITTLQSFFEFKTRADKGFTPVSAVKFIQLLSVPVGIILIWKFGYYALYSVSLLSALIGLILFAQMAKRQIKLVKNATLLKAIIKSGLPLLVSSLLYTLIDTVDKFIILGLLDVEALGLYTIAQSAFSFIVLVPSALSQIFYLEMGKEYGRSKNVRTLCKTANSYTCILSIVVSLICVICIFAISPFVKVVLPKYIDGIHAAQIIVVGLSIYAPTMVNSNILTIMRKNAALIRSSCYLLALDTILSIAFVCLFHNGIDAVAYGTSVAYAIRTFILIIQIKVHVGGRISSSLFSSVIPTLINIIPAVIVNMMMPSWLLGLGVSVAICIAIDLIYFKAYQSLSTYHGDDSE